MQFWKLINSMPFHKFCFKLATIVSSREPKIHKVFKKNSGISTPAQYHYRPHYHHDSFKFVQAPFPREQGIRGFALEGL